MDEIEITISDTEFTLKNGFTLCTPFEVCAIASLDMDGDEIDSMALEAVVGAKGQVVPVNVSDFITLWFEENQNAYKTKFYENLSEYGFAERRSDYDEHRSY